MLTDEGFDHLNDILSEYFGIKFTRDTFKQYEDQFVEGVDTSYGFYSEANDGALGDTLVRGYIAWTLATIFTDHEDWPCLGDPKELHDDFKIQYLEAVSNVDGITILV